MNSITQDMKYRQSLLVELQYILDSEEKKDET